MTTGLIAGRAGRVPSALLATHEATMLDVARTLFYEYGFERTSIETIARAAHVSPKTLYSRFGNKEGLFFAALRARTDDILALLRPPLAHGDDVSASLIDFGTLLLTVMMLPEAIHMQRLIIAETARFPELGSAFFEAGPKRGMTSLAAFFARATTDGTLCVPDAQAAAEMYVGALIGQPSRAALLQGTKLSRRAIVAKATAVATLFVAAYAPQRGAKRTH